ncbi:MAG: hypothetical protein P8X97_04960 [Candidatus Bathyarchaeota archaeon]
MNPLLKKFHLVLVIVTVVTLPLIQAPNVYSVEFSAPEKAMTFLTDVIGLDLVKYNSTLTNNRLEYRPDLGDLSEEYGQYSLLSDESNLDVRYRVLNGTLHWFRINVFNGSPLYTKESTDVLDLTKDILQRYQNYAGISNIQTMRDMLDTVTEIKPMTKTVGNIKLKISTGNYTYIDWIYTSNGIDFERKRIHFSFHNGNFRSFWDGWNLYKIGSDRINVSEEEAINIAINTTKIIPKLYGITIDNETIVMQPKIANEPIETELMVGIREPLTLYPLWHVQRYFDKVYGNYYGVAVDIWANTGKISGTPYGTGIMGSFHDIENSEETQTEQLTTVLTEDYMVLTGLDLTQIIIALPIVLAIIFGATFYRRKKNKKQFFVSKFKLNSLNSYNKPKNQNVKV